MAIYYQKGLTGAYMRLIPSKLADFETLLRANPVEIEPKDKIETVKIGGQSVSRAKGQQALYFISGDLKDNRRKNENLISRNLLIADIDEGIRSVESLHERLNERLIAYSFYLYPSTSFTEESLKFRLVIDSERAMAEQEYMATLKEIEKLIEIEFDDKSYTWAQMMGLPITDDVEQFNQVKLTNEGDPYRVKEVEVQQVRKKPLATTGYQSTGRKGRIPQLLEEVYRGIENGNRNVFFTRAYGTLITANVAPDIAIKIVRDWNENYTEPPLSDGELVGIIKSINDRERKKVNN